jgi:hypothetical protein
MAKDKRECKNCSHWYYTFDGQYDEHCRKLKLILVESVADTCKHYFPKSAQMLNVVLPEHVKRIIPAGKE